MNRHGIEGLPGDVDELVDDFSLFADWEQRYGYLIDLGKRLPALPESRRCDETLVRGCVSQVWFDPEDRGDGRLWWSGDSDSTIVRGLIAVLQVAFGGANKDDVAKVDIDDVFGQLGLERHLSVNRRNGFYAMVSRLRGISAGAVDA